MRIAVIQHRLRATPAQDLEALVISAGRAVARGAEVVLLPPVPAVDEGPLADELWRRLAESLPDAFVLSAGAQPGESGDGEVSDVAPLGRVLVLRGDAAIDPAALTQAGSRSPDVVVLAPGSESDLQAEAVLELAIGLSTSLAALVAIVEPDGAEIGEPGHGGSAIVYLGEVLAEALAGDDVIVADVATPVGPPEPRGTMPAPPPLLAQRLAAHKGAKVSVDYPADLD